MRYAFVVVSLVAPLEPVRVSLSSNKINGMIWLMTGILTEEVQGIADGPLDAAQTLCGHSKYRQLSLWA